MVGAGEGFFFLAAAAAAAILSTICRTLKF
jgi:hypothetical protein